MNNRPIFAVFLILLAQAGAAAPGQSSTRLVESPLSTSNLVDTALGLLLVLGVMLALAWLVRRYVQVPGIGKGQVQILGGVSLGAREKAVLLSVEGRRLLVGVAPGRVQTLMLLHGEAEPGPDFADQLEAATTRTAQTEAEGAA
jgi:flagellar protein FliO/FliZ